MAKKSEAAARLERKARDKLNERLADRRAIEKLNEADLVAFFGLAETVERATEVRAKAIAAAGEVYKATVANAEDDKARRVWAIKERGETVDGLAALTELSESQIRTLLRRGRKLADETGDTATGAGTPDADSVDAGNAASAAAQVADSAENSETADDGAAAAVPVAATV